MAFAFELDSQSNDLVLSDLGAIQTVSGPILVAQRLRVRLNWMLGEWLLDLRRGIDYLGSILVKGPNLEIVRAIFADEITETPGVERLLSLTLALDGRTLNVTFSVLAGDSILQVTAETQDFTSIFLTLSVTQVSILTGLGTIIM